MLRNLILDYIGVLRNLTFDCIGVFMIMKFSTQKYILNHLQRLDLHEEF